MAEDNTVFDDDWELADDEEMPECDGSCVNCSIMCKYNQNDEYNSHGRAPNYDHEDKTLKSYCHYPLLLANQDIETGHKQMYRIVTINWTYATDHFSGSKAIDYEYVHKNIYEMTLGEFLEWWMEMEEVAEVVISIEKICE